MSSTQSVLSYLAHSFSSHPENLATEALNFVIGRSAIAREAMRRFIGEFGYQGTGELTFETQVTDEAGARPDLIGRSAGGEIEVLVEVKFWAGLTDRQPVGYLDSFNGENRCLLFVAPAARVEVLWPELCRRVESSGRSCGPTSPLGDAGRVRRVGSHSLAVTSWRALLGALLGATEAAGDAACVADIKQLASLCDQMDSEAFLPLRSEELTGDTARRILQFGELVNALTSALVGSGLADIKGLRPIGSNGFYGRYLRLSGYAACINFSAKKWADWGDSPLWLSIRGPDWKASPAVRASLLAGGIRFRESDSWCQVPLPLATHAERSVVIDGAMAMLKAVSVALPSVVSSDVLPPPPDATAVASG